MTILSCFPNAVIFIFVFTMATKQQHMVNPKLRFVEIFILIFSFNRPRMSDFWLARKIISWQSTVGVNSTPTAHTFFSCAACSACLAHSQCHAQIVTHTRGSRLSPLSVSCPKNTHTSLCHVTLCTSLEHHTFTWFRHSFLVFDRVLITRRISLSERDTILRRSTSPPEWRLGWAPHPHSFFIFSFNPFFSPFFDLFSILCSQFSFFNLFLSSFRKSSFLNPLCFESSFSFCFKYLFSILLKSEDRGSRGFAGGRWGCHCWRRKMLTKFGRPWRGPCMMETSLLCRLCVHFWGGERPLGGVDPRGAWRGTRTTFKDGKTKLGFTTEGFSGTHRWRDGPAKGRTG